MKKAWLHQKAPEKIIFPFYYNCKTCSCQRSDSALKGQCWWTEITAELPRHCPGHHKHSLVKVAPEEMMEVLRFHCMCQTQWNFAYYKHESKISAITMVSLISKCFYHRLDSVLNSAVKTLGNKIYLTQKYTALSLQKYHRSWTAQEYFNANPYSVFAP